ncbi:MAG: hypothetical protein AB1726_13660 [Planctomycetota bacterium]
MKRILLAAAAVALAVFGIRRLVIALAADETRIGWLIEDMVEGFNERHAGEATSGLAPDWRHEDLEGRGLR